MLFWCVCCVGICICDGLVTRSEESYWVCDLEIPRTRQPRPELGCCSTEKGTASAFELLQLLNVTHKVLDAVALHGRHRGRRFTHRHFFKRIYILLTPDTDILGWGTPNIHRRKGSCAELEGWEDIRHACCRLFVTWPHSCLINGDRFLC